MLVNLLKLVRTNYSKPIAIILEIIFGPMLPCFFITLKFMANNSAIAWYLMYCIYVGIQLLKTKHGLRSHGQYTIMLLAYQINFYKYDMLSVVESCCVLLVKVFLGHV